MDHFFGVGEDGPAVVGEEDLHLTAHLLHQGFVISHIIYAGEGVEVFAEQAAVVPFGEDVVPGVDAFFIQLVQADQVVAHLIGGVTEHQDHLFQALGNALEADGEPVAAEDGEDNPHCVIPAFLVDVGGDVVDVGVVALAPGDHSFGDGDNVFVPQGEALRFGCADHRIGHDFDKVIPLADNGCAHAPDNGTNHSFHSECSFLWVI